MLAGVIILYCLGVGSYGIAGYIFGWGAGSLIKLLVRAIIWPISLIIRLIKWILKKFCGIVSRPMREYHQDKKEYNAFLREQKRQDDYNRRADKWDKQRGINTKGIK